MTGCSFVAMADHLVGCIGPDAREVDRRPHPVVAAVVSGLARADPVVPVRRALREHVFLELGDDRRVQLRVDGGPRLRAARDVGGDRPDLLLHLGGDGRDVQGAREPCIDIFEDLGTQQILVAEVRNRRRGGDRRPAERGQREALLKGHCAVAVAPQLHARQQLGFARVELDAGGARRNPRRRARSDERELPAGVRREGALVDVGDDLAPFVEDLGGVVAAGDLRDLEQRRGSIVHGDPGFEIRDIEIRVHEVRGPQRVVLDGVVRGAMLLQILVLLPDHEHAAQEVDVGVSDGLRVRHSRRHDSVTWGR
jgi:hypothetical protein